MLPVANRRRAKHEEMPLMYHTSWEIQIGVERGRTSERRWHKEVR